MKEVILKERLYFVNPNGSLWFELTDAVKKLQMYNLRLKLGGDRAIHEIKTNDSNVPA
jgi:hypothetical protein